MLLGIGQHRVAELLCVLGRERRHLEPVQLSIDAQLRRRTGRQMQITCTLFDHRLQELMHVRHGDWTPLFSSSRRM